MTDLLSSKGAESQQLFELARVPFRFSRPFLAPPGMPENMVSTLRAAILMTLQDPDLRADMEKAKIEVNPVPGEEVQQLVVDYLKAPKAQVDRLQAEMAKDLQQ
jgi:tripartite-type tricarboxylate transporter receptor subunit TctC